MIWGYPHFWKHQYEGLQPYNDGNFGVEIT